MLRKNSQVQMAIVGRFQIVSANSPRGRIGAQHTLPLRPPWPSGSAHFPTHTCDHLVRNIDKVPCQCHLTEALSVCIIAASILSLFLHSSFLYFFRWHLIFKNAQTAKWHWIENLWNCFDRHLSKCVTQADWLGCLESCKTQPILGCPIVDFL